MQPSSTCTKADNDRRKGSIGLPFGAASDNQMKGKGGEIMRKVVLVLVGFILILTYGCCGKEYVKQEQLVPLQQQVNKVQTDAAAARKDAAEAKSMAADAQKNAAQAAQMAAGAADASRATADRAEAAAKRAEDAAARAEAAAGRAEKAFELKQRK